MLAVVAKAKWRSLMGDREIKGAITVLVVLPLLLFVVYPLWSILKISLLLEDGSWGLGNYTRYFADPRFLEIINNSLLVAGSTTVITLVLAYTFAYALCRSAIPFKKVWQIIATIPLFAPSLVQALGVIFLLGRNGLISRTFDIEIDIYGFWGILIADVLYTFPHALLILITALSYADARHYESARMLGAKDWRIFWTITLPATKFGVMSAVFVVFTITITDFGNPMVIGGDFSVLATEIYNQVSGQANFNLGAVIGMVLLVPAGIAAAVERLVSRRQAALITGQSVPLAIRPDRRFDTVMLTCVAVVSLAVVAVIGIIVFASFVRLWPYNMSLTLRNYQFDVQNGLDPLWTSVWMAMVAALIGVVMVTASAYMVQKLDHWVTRVLYFLSILPAAVPGMVLGLGYIFAFNDPANPVYLLYGTVLLLAINTVYHYHAQSFLIATTGIKQVSVTFDEASTVLGGGFLRTMGKITLPLIWPSLLRLGVFNFMCAMVTLSAVIFLVSPSTNLAAVSVLLLDDAGETAQAAAFSTLIMLIVVVSLIIFQTLMRLLGVRNVSLIQ